MNWLYIVKLIVWNAYYPVNKLNLSETRNDKAFCTWLIGFVWYIWNNASRPVYWICFTVVLLIRCISESPKGQGNCPRLNGLHKDPKGCGNFYKCENGTVVPDKCADGFEFDDHTKLCRLATPQERKKCSHSSPSSGMIISQVRNLKNTYHRTLKNIYLVKNIKLLINPSVSSWL
jgi:hypothetical protein